jgi:hypothetical protein
MPARPCARAAIGGVFAALVLAIPIAAAATEAAPSATAAAGWIEDGALCLRIEPERDPQGRLLAAALSAPRYRLGLRLHGEDCRDIDAAPIAAAQLAEQLDALRAAAQDAAQHGCATAFARSRFDEAAAVLPLDDCAERLAEASPPAPAEPAPIGPNPSPETSEPQPPDALSRWVALRERLRPDGLRVDGSWDRDRVGSRLDSEIHLRGSAHWQAGVHRVEFELEHQQRRRDGALRKNQQGGSLAWNMDIGERWFSQTELQLERDRVSIEGLTLDYLITQAASGFGPRWQPSPSFDLRIAAQWYRLRLRLLDLGLNFYVDGPAAFVQAHWRPLQRLRLSADARLARWPDGSEGLDLNAELLFELSRTTGLGLRREINRNTASLNRADEDEVELFLRYRF